MKKNRLPYCKNVGFRVPEDYFGTLEDRIMSRVAMSERENELPTLDQNPFAVPENYFDSLEEKVMEKWQTKERKESKVIRLLNKEAFYYVAGVAAVFVAIFTNVLFQQPEPFTWEHLDMVTMEGYIDESIDYSTPEISQMLSEDNFSFAPTSQPSQVDQEAVMEYLHENFEETSLILNED